MNEAPSRGSPPLRHGRAGRRRRAFSRAGALTAELEGGNLRYIRFGGVEMIRAVSFIVRDKNWGTYNPAISESANRRGMRDGFRVSYAAVARDAAQEFAYAPRSSGRRTGRCGSRREGVAVDRFPHQSHRLRRACIRSQSVAGQARAVTETATGETSRRGFPN